MNFLCFLCVVLVGVTFGYPSKYGYNPGPRHAYMFGGYYNNPIFARSREFIPQGSMSAVLTGDTLATNSFSGSPLVPEGQLPLEDPENEERYPEKYHPQTVGEEQPEEIDIDHQNNPSQGPELILDEKEQGIAVAEEASTETVAAAKPPKRVSKKRTGRKPVKKEEEEADEEDESGSWPFAGARGIPSYNAFFPINISGGSPIGRRAKYGDDEGYGSSGSATAIANSFSTGRGGIATSHATSFGDPYMASRFLKNGNFNTKSTKTDQEA
ncbi:hypothetical protein JTB14_010689 [Gonioctena quinquepunctata]|nr:hypothetical protein JTB14_010689 [Gonioctena quinquepunctata]